MPASTTIAVASASPHCSMNSGGRPGANVLRISRRHISATIYAVRAALAIAPVSPTLAAIQDAFGPVLVAVVVGATVVALITFLGSSNLYDQIGRGGLSIDEEKGRGKPLVTGGGGGAVSRVERDAEIRQMLEARSERRVRRGEEPLDIDAEVARLNAPQIDAGLEAEIRQLVIARNERRVRMGEEPLDVDGEVARQVRELG